MTEPAGTRLRQVNRRQSQIHGQEPTAGQQFCGSLYGSRSKVKFISAELRHIEDYDDIYGASKTYDIETFKIDGEGSFFGKFW